MRALIQRTSWSKVEVQGREVAFTGPGLLVLLGVAHNDGEDAAVKMAVKTASLRIFEDENGRMNRSVKDIGGEIMIVSQFTLLADTTKGNRPGFGSAAEPAKAQALYERFVQEIKVSGVAVKTGIFGADMAVSLENDGPVTVLLDTQEKIRR